MVVSGKDGWHLAGLGLLRLDGPGSPLQPEAQAGAGECPEKATQRGMSHQGQTQVSPLPVPRLWGLRGSLCLCCPPPSPKGLLLPLPASQQGAAVPWVL